MSKSEIVLFKSEERKTLDEIATFLRDLADRLETRQVILRRGHEEVTLSLPDSVTLELKAEEEHGRGAIKHSLEIELEWREGDKATGSVTLG